MQIQAEELLKPWESWDTQLRYLNNSLSFLNACVSQLLLTQESLASLGLLV